MAWRPHGRFQVNPNSPRALGTCDRCGFCYNLERLKFQYDWAGTEIINLGIRVCYRCMDKPSEAAKRAFTIPPDPLPVKNPRPENYTVDEQNSFQEAPPTPTPTTPSNRYVAENGVDFYVAEDGSTYYTQEN